MLAVAWLLLLSPGPHIEWIGEACPGASQVLAYDHGFWEGNAVDVVARDDVAYVLFAGVNPDPGGHVGLAMVRKYVL